MIEIFIKITNNDLYINVKGHSLLDKKGKDLLCCAVSVLIQNWYFSELEICGKKNIKLNKTNNNYEIKLENYDNNDKLLFKSLCLGLLKLEEQYKKNIKIIMEGYNVS